MLPQGPEWKAQEINVNGYSTEEPIILYYHEGIECLKTVISSPLLRNHIDFSPKRVHDSNLHRIFGEWMTSDGAWSMQVLNQHCVFDSEVTMLILFLV
jgi:Plavaka transposase